MSNQRYSPESKDEAVRQILDGGHSTTEVAARLGVSANSLYKWVKAVQPNTDSLKDEELIEAKRENIKLRAELRRVKEERDILKKAARYLAQNPE
jgi:transposase